MPDTPGSPARPDPARGVFLSDLAHDLSTPLTAIHGATELALAGTYGPLEGELRSLMLEVQASARELRAFVQDVADLGALETGRLTFASAPVDIAGLAGQLRSAFADAAAKRSVGFSLDAHVDGPVLSDERRLRQIFSGLFGYAVKASRRGSQVTASVSLVRGFLRAEVRSTGISTREPDTLFADRRDPTPGVPKAYCGPGLGLPLIGRVVAAWGGETSAEHDGALVLRVDVPVR